MSQTLCIHCQNLSGAWLVLRFFDLRDSKYPAHEQPVLWWTYPSWDELEISAKSCSLCSLIVNEAQSVTQGPYMKSDRPGIRFQANGSSRLEIWCVEKLKCVKLNVAFDGGMYVHSRLTKITFQCGWKVKPDTLVVTNIALQRTFPERRNTRTVSSMPA